MMTRRASLVLKVDWPPKISFGGQSTLFLNGSFVELLPLSEMEVTCSVM